MFLLALSADRTRTLLCSACKTRRTQRSLVRANRALLAVLVHRDEATDREHLRSNVRLSERVENDAMLASDSGVKFYVIVSTAHSSSSISGIRSPRDPCYEASSKKSQIRGRKQNCVGSEEDTSDLCFENPFFSPKKC